MNRWLALGVLLATGVALGLRCPRLGLRPMHNDEAVNAIKFGRLWEQGAYKYDPHEFHGPTLPYATKWFSRLTVAPDFIHFSENRLRGVTVAFGIGLLLLIPLVSDGLGRSNSVWAAFLTAVSPAFVFYSRYYIHEMLLVFATFLAIAGGWRYWRSRKLIWAVVTGMGLGLMHATKETFVINIAAAAVGLAGNRAWDRLVDASAAPARLPPLNFRHLAAGLATWAIVAVLFFTSFFTNAGGLTDSIRTYLPWFQRAGGASPHIYPWYFYAQRLLFFHVPSGPVWSEAVIAALAVIGAAAAFARKELLAGDAWFIRFLALYALALAAAYSLIGYKTPWCLLGFWHGAILLAGVGAGVLVNFSKNRWVGLGLKFAIAIGVVHLAGQAWRASADERFCADRKNPYVFAQTSRDILKLVSKVEAIAAANSEGRGMVVKVMAPESEFWPLPWYFRGFVHTGWWDSIPADPFAPMMIVSAQFRAALDDRKTHLMVGIFELRPGVFFELYVELETWKTYLAKNPPAPDRD